MHIFKRLFEIVARSYPSNFLFRIKLKKKKNKKKTVSDMLPSLWRRCSGISDIKVNMVGRAKFWGNKLGVSTPI